MNHTVSSVGLQPAVTMAATGTTIYLPATGSYNGNSSPRVRFRHTHTQHNTAHYFLTLFSGFGSSSVSRENNDDDIDGSSNSSSSLAA